MRSQAAGGRLLIAGVATYEGAAAQPDPGRTDEAVSALLATTADMFLRLRARVGGGVPLIVTAGGSVFFDKVVAAAFACCFEGWQCDAGAAQRRHLLPRSWHL